MRRINTPNKSPDLFGPGKDGFRNGDLAIGVLPTELDADFFNHIQEELSNLVESMGITLNPANRSQVLESIQRLIDAQSGNYALDTGAANAYVVAINPAITVYADGMTVRVKAVNTNTGASTLNAGGGAVALRNDVGAALVAGDVPAGGVFTAVYISSANQFYITGLVPSQAMSQAAADARYIQPAAAPATVGQFRNLRAASTGLNANVSVLADEIVVENATNEYTTLRAVALTLAGTAVGANGLDAGVIAASTWYSLWVIWNGATVSGLMSLSATAPTLPGGYTHKARVGWIRTDGSVNKYPLSFTQTGRNVQYLVAVGSNVTALPQMATGAAGNTDTPTWAAVGVSAFVPSTAGQIDITAGSAVNSVIVIVAPNSGYGSRVSAANPPPLIVNNYTTAIGMSSRMRMVLETLNIYWAATGASSNYLLCNGWEDQL